MVRTAICFTYFKSLGLANLEAALYSVRRQNFDHVKSFVIVDNDTQDDIREIGAIVDALRFPLIGCVVSSKHGDPTRTHSWSTNMAVRAADAPWIFFCRADYILDFEILNRFVALAETVPDDQDVFISSHGCHLPADVARCNETDWRASGVGALGEFAGAQFDYTDIDAGVWMTRRRSFDAVGGLDERLTAWGHAQTHFQWKLHEAGVQFIRIPEVLFWHPHHGAPRDIDLAHRQLGDLGVDLKQMWARYEGVSPY